MIEASSDACSVIITVKSLINLSAYTLSTSRPDNAIAVTGLACFTVTAAVSPIAGQSEIELVNQRLYKYLCLHHQFSETRTDTDVYGVFCHHIFNTIKL